MRIRRSRGAGDTPVAEQLSLLDTAATKATTDAPGSSQRRLGMLSGGLGRRASAVALAVAAALAGSITTGRSGMWASSSDKKADDVADTSELGGFLPVELEEADMELAAFEDPEFLEDVPVNEEEVSDDVEEVLDGDEVVETLGDSGIPEVALEAYNDAADVQDEADPACGVRWSLLAAIGRVESNHGRFGGAKLKSDGYGTKPIRGIPLDGRPNVALIRDTDNGELDGDTTYDRAVGPMQFIPSTWRSVGQDGNDDDRADPNNIFDAAQGAGAYLCAGSADLNSMVGQAAAVRRYNNADSYVRLVLRLATMYETGEVRPLPDIPIPPPASTPSAPRPKPTTPPTSAPTRPTPPPSNPTPTTVPPTTSTTVPPTTSTTVPPTTVPPTTVPPTTAPDGTTTTTVVTEPVPPAPSTPPAAVGWAPAMREVVVDILEGAECPDDDASDPAAPADSDADDAAVDPADCPNDPPDGTPADGAADDAAATDDPPVVATPTDDDG